MTAATSMSSAVSLRGLLDARAPASEIEAFMNDLSPQARVEQSISITGSGLKRLYEAVADAKLMSLEEFVPQSTKGTLIYEGRNSLPVFSRFQKRFARVQGGAVVVGHNHQTMSFVTGPGYFVVKPASGEGEHGRELLFDYTATPPSEPDGWPRIAPNDKGLSTLVFGGLNDYIRRVGRGVVVGKAYRRGVDQNQYFSLALPA